MAFDAIETSDYYSTAVFLYEFQLGGNFWRYTSADSDIAAAGFAWEHAAIEHDKVTQSGDAEQDNVSMTVDSTIPPALAYLGSAPTQEMIVRFRKAHDGDADAQVFFVGLVSSVDWPEPGKVTFALVTLSATMARQGLTLTYQRACRNVLYSEGRGACKAPKEEFGVEATVVTTAQGIVTLDGVEGYPDGWFDGGFLEWTDSRRGLERRTVERFNGGPDVRIFGLSDGLYEDMVVKIYAGCAHTADACENKFNNMENYGGQPQLPGNSPFDGDPVGGD